MRMTRLLFVLACLFFNFSATAALPTSVDGQPLPTLAPMLEKVTPAVVNIATEGRVVTRSPLFDDPFFRRFFDMPEGQQERRSTGLGSGVIFDAKKGYIVTNAHVVANADNIVVTLTNGQTHKATIVGKDPEADVAIIKVDGNNLTQIPLADSEQLRVGDFVVAIGNPFGLGQTVTSGIISALGRSGLGIESYEDFIQTDASINPGNSGGALVNLRGELVGINTAILGPSGGNVGIGFAIPINMVSQIAEQLIEHGEVKRGRLGFTAQDLTPDLAQAFGIERTKGVVVARVEEGSSATQAGLRTGDVIVAINSREVQSAAEVRNMIGLMQIGTRVSLDILRNGKTHTLNTVIAERVVSTVMGEKVSEKLRGAKLEELSEDEGAGRGILIATVDPGSAAARAGLHHGDIIRSVNKQAVATIRDMKRAVSANRDGLLLNIQRSDRGLFILIQ